MKVIVAGFSKTGTKSINAALSELGYEVYDFLENFVYLNDFWTRVVDGRSSIEDFRRTFEKIDAVCDLPCCLFWEELHQAFPDAKIILTTRDEESWIESFKQQNTAVNSNFFALFVMMFSPTVWKVGTSSLALAKLGYGTSGQVWNSRVNELYARLAFRRHNIHVLNSAPKDKLLVYSVKDGWGPLCQFLDKPQPTGAFPHKNKDASLYDDLLASHHIFAKLKREAFCVLGLFLLFVAVCVAVGVRCLLDALV